MISEGTLKLRTETCATPPKGFVPDLVFRASHVGSDRTVASRIVTTNKPLHDCSKRVNYAWWQTGSCRGPFPFSWHCLSCFRRRTAAAGPMKKRDLDALYTVTMGTSYASCPLLSEHIECV